MKLQPYIQQHSFNLEPLRPKAKGFAAFLDVIGEDKPDEVIFEHPKGHMALNEMITRNGSTTFSQTGKSREKTAVSGELTSGFYSFTVKGSSAETITLAHQSHLLKTPEIISKRGLKGWTVEWENEPAFSNFWIFAAPDSIYMTWTDLFHSLKPLSENQYSDHQILIEENPFGPDQPYRVLVRANQQEEKECVRRFSKESWGASEALV